MKGNGASQLVALMKAIGHNVEAQFEIGTVTALSPLEIKTDSDGIKLDSDDFILAEHLTTHERTGTFSTSAVTVNMDAAGQGPHTHTVNSIDASSITLAIDSPLKVNDKVILVALDEGQNYIVLDKAVV